MSIHISIGPNCHPAFHLRRYGLGRESYPFDWLLVDKAHGIEYISKLLATDFRDFTSNLQAAENGKTVSAVYPYAQFFHHDPKIKENYDTLWRRVRRFQTTLQNEQLKVFYYCLYFQVTQDQKLLSKTIADIQELCFLLNSKNVHFKLVIYVCKENDYRYYLPSTLTALNSEQIIIKRYTKNTRANKLWGNPSDFKHIIYQQQ